MLFQPDISVINVGSMYLMISSVLMSLAFYINFINNALQTLFDTATKFYIQKDNFILGRKKESSK